MKLTLESLIEVRDILASEDIRNYGAWVVVSEDRIREAVGAMNAAVAPLSGFGDEPERAMSIDEFSAMLCRKSPGFGEALAECWRAEAAAESLAGFGEVPKRALTPEVLADGIFKAAYGHVEETDAATVGDVSHLQGHPEVLARLRFW